MALLDDGWLPGRPRLGMGQDVGLGLCPLSRPDAKEPLRTGGGPKRSHQEVRSGASVIPGRPYAHAMGDRVLVVDDEPSILRVVAANLRARGYEALTAASGNAALTAIETQQPDCIVLDLGLPDVGGLEVLRRLRAWTTTPVVILTAVDDQHRKATALDLGADDYITKPFTMTDLLARIRGALQYGQSQSLDRPRRIEVGPVCIDLDAGLVTRWGQPVQLTRTEYRLLELLATSGGRLCTSRFLSERLWGPGSEYKGRSLRDLVASLRRKLDDPSVPELVVTEPGIGYRFVVPA
jgi:two-component system, OmpR family, KDP operon response regulator KdpE